MVWDSKGKVKLLQSNPQCFYSNQQQAEGATERKTERTSEKKMLNQ